LIIPGMTGSDLAQKLQLRRPRIRAIFISSYPGSNLLVLSYGWHIVAEPDLPAKLPEIVRSTLDSPLEMQATDHFDWKIAAMAQPDPFPLGQSVREWAGTTKPALRARAAMQGDPESVTTLSGESGQPPGVSRH
jgi:hypothetical protein